MKNKKIILVVLIVILLILTCTIASTYAVIVNVTNKNGILEIVNKITIKDLLINDDGTYNNTYYNVINTLDITFDEVSTLMESESLNEKLQIVLNTVVDYKINNNVTAKLSNDEIYNLIVDGINNTNNITEELKNKVITKSSEYINDVSDFLYDIEVSLLEDY
ncbi:MAG: hypothetical protein ACI4VL_05150 [Bacilli bacterium]